MKLQVVVNGEETFSQDMKLKPGEAGGRATGSLHRKIKLKPGVWPEGFFEEVEVSYYPLRKEIVVWITTS